MTTSSISRFGFPHLGFGVGLRPPHYEHIFNEQPAIDWFEVLSENYMGTRGRPLYKLDKVAERYPLVLHGVSMSIGTTDPIDFDYLRELKALAQRIDAKWVSDHVCWTGLAHQNSHDLLPMPYNEESLAHIVDRIRVVQDFMERPLSFENASTYLEFKDSTMTEWEFLARMADEADCGILLDINNIYVSCFNHGWDSQAYLDAVPWDRVVQFHLAGHTNKGDVIIDTHSDHVIDEVWALYREAYRRSGGRPTLVEWDEDIPGFEVVHGEALEARRQAQEGERRATARAGEDDARTAAVRDGQERTDAAQA